MKDPNEIGLQLEKVFKAKTLRDNPLRSIIDLDNFFEFRKWLNIPLFGIAGLVIPFYTGVAPSIVAFLLVFISAVCLVWVHVNSIKQRNGTALLVWLRPFDKRIANAFQFDRHLYTNSRFIFTPITLEDSSFRYSLLKSGAGLWMIGTSIVLLVLILGLIVSGTEGIKYYLAVPFIMIPLLISFVMYTIDMHEEIKKLDGDMKVDNIISNIEKGDYYSTNVTVLKCEDDVWRDRVLQVMKKANVVLIDITELGPGILWEVKTGFEELKIEKISFAYGLEKHQEPQLPNSTVDSLWEVGNGYSKEEISKIPTFFYPREGSGMEFTVEKETEFSQKLRNFLLELYIRNNQDMVGTLIGSSPVLSSPELQLKTCPDSPALHLPESEPTTPEGMAFIQKGTFLYGDDIKVATIGYDFHMGIHPVTNDNFAKFIEGSGYENETYWTGEGWAWKERERIDRPKYWNDSKWTAAECPVVGVSYYEAEAYANWEGKRLPIEQEWEKAARGTDGRLYPWGNDFDDAKCNYGQLIWFGTPTTPVNNFPAGKSFYGCYDMAGNVWEWCDSWHEQIRGHRVIRGGSWLDNEKFLRCYFRNRFLPGQRDSTIGFRLVQDIP